MKKNGCIKTIRTFVMMTVFGAIAATAQTTEFSYQGFLNDNNASANGSFDFEFRLFDVSTGGTALAAQQRTNITVINGVFSVTLDFGGFPAATRYLEIAVRPSGSGALTTLTPRSKILSTPYATNALNAQNAANATNAQTAQTALTAANATNAENAATAANALNAQNATNSTNAINAQNAVNAQNATNATNAANATNATTAENALQLGGIAANQFVQTTDARLSDARNPLPNSLNYIQNTAALKLGSFNITGSGTVGGTLSGNIVNAATQFNINGARILSNPGLYNTFAGIGAGQNNTASANSFFGDSAGFKNTSGQANAFFGWRAGEENTTGDFNSLFGYAAGVSNRTGSNNSFFGTATGIYTTGDNNSFFGEDTGYYNSTGTNNSYFGQEAGRGSSDSTGSNNSFFGRLAGRNLTSGSNNTFAGAEAGYRNSSGSNNTAVGYNADFDESDLTNATAIGANAYVTQSNALVLGGINGTNGATTNTFVGIGTTAPQDKLHVVGFARFESLGAAGSTQLCRNASFQLSTCSSSLRYKTDVSPFSSGFQLVNQLQPIVFTWKDSGIRDLGLGAEDVAAVESLLVTRNDKGEIEGVKYDRVAVVLLNAVKEQQTQIERQQAENHALKAQIDEQTKRYEMLETQLIRQQAAIAGLAESFRKDAANAAKKKTKKRSRK